ncbi:MAG TPA: PA14 domain-containing protein [Tepidisphaeraceae bacterium]|nr:PA14 domain-containing protein [Tepidisphaeraceae bacterium]
MTKYLLAIVLLSLGGTLCAQQLKTDTESAHPGDTSLKLAADAPAAVADGTRQEIDLSGSGWKLWQDKDAKWQTDPLFLPPVDLSKLTVNPPTGGWDVLGKIAAANVSIPGTAEEYLQTTPGPAGDITGVTWWYRDVQIPASPGPRKILLRLESVRQRAEVYVNQKLVGYDLVGNTPFEVDCTPAAQSGQTVQLAIRITDPGGNFDWHDKGLIDWGGNRLLWSHGFGGITGRVKLIACDPVYVDDIYVQNTPAITDINAQITIQNTTAAPIQRDIIVRVLDKQNPSSEIARQEIKNANLAPGSNLIPVKVSAPNAKLWDTDHPNLYICKVSLGDSDSAQQVFGFRWFEPSGIGKDATFRLNGKRIVVRSAISWGFWPINGIYATEEMAEKQIRAAKDMGQNMLNFHRCIGQPIILEKADEMGLLYYEEPGNYDSGTNDNNPMARGIAREKILRMVKRDRSHPSMIIYNMSNETGPNPAALKNYEIDMKEAHAIDPSRIITRSSGLRCTPGIGVEMNTKMHMRPYDTKVYLSGWYDDHHAGGPAVWTQTFYRSPTDYYHRLDNSPEINYWGEEGAISTPPRLGLIKQQLDRSPHMGWDGGMYLDWYKMFDDYITAKNLRSAFPTVDSLCKAMGDLSMQHQGRKIEVIRINNDTDGYAINGWESEILENHSGVVDCFRNPKGDPSIIAYYNQPLYVAVMPRSQVVHLPGKVTVDFYAINEKDLHGPHTLRIGVTDSSGHALFEKQIGVLLAGGDVYGQLLSAGVEIAIPEFSAGMVRINAALIDPQGAEKATGHDDVFALNWWNASLTGKGAMLDNAARVRRFLQRSKSLDVPDYADNAGPLDWVIVAAAPNTTAATLVPVGQLRDMAGQNPGLQTTIYKDQNFSQIATQRSDETVDLYAPDGAPLDPGVDMLTNYSVRMAGQLIPPATGKYTFVLQASGTATLNVNGAIGTTFDLEAGKAVPIRIDWRQSAGDAQCRLLWKSPATSAAPDPQKLIDRVKNQGTNLVILENAADWMPLIQKNTSIQYDGAFAVGHAWAGGVHFVKAHPLFKDLPVDSGMDWPYQAVVRDGSNRNGLRITGDELAAGAFHANMSQANPPAPIALGTAVGVIPCGKGKIIVSTLDICSNLSGPPGPADVARKLLCNFIQYASTKEKP